MHLMVSLGCEKAYTCLCEVIGDTWQEYILTITFNEFMKSGFDYYDPIYFFHFFNRDISLHRVYEVTPEQYQLI